MSNAEYNVAVKYPTAGRVYFINVATGEELAGFDYYGNSCAGIRNGVRYTNTTMGVTVVDHNARTVRTIDASEFPGRRVVAKIWYPNGHWKGQAATERNVEFLYLVGGRAVWQGNEADTGNLPRRRLGR